MNAPVPTVTLDKVPAETEAERSGSNSTSSQTTEPVVYTVALAVLPDTNVPVAESLTEYPNLPAP